MVTVFGLDLQTSTHMRHGDELHHVRPGQRRAKEKPLRVFAVHFPQTHGFLVGLDAFRHHGKFQLMRECKLGSE